MDDWRLRGQESFLQGVALVKKKYHAYSDDWDHDHCEFCMSKFSKDPTDLHDGYTTLDEYHWVCPTCFEDFRVAFAWTLLEAETADNKRQG